MAKEGFFPHCERVVSSVRKSVSDYVRAFVATALTKGLPSVNADDPTWLSAWVEDVFNGKLNLRDVNVAARQQLNARQTLLKRKTSALPKEGLVRFDHLLSQLQTKNDPLRKVRARGIWLSDVRERPVRLVLGPSVSPLASYAPAVEGTCYLRTLGALSDCYWAGAAISFQIMAKGTPRVRTVHECHSLFIDLKQPFQVGTLPYINVAGLIDALAAALDDGALDQLDQTTRDRAQAKVLDLMRDLAKHEPPA